MAIILLKRVLINIKHIKPNLFSINMQLKLMTSFKHKWRALPSTAEAINTNEEYCHQQRKPSTQMKSIAINSGSHQTNTAPARSINFTNYGVNEPTLQRRNLIVPMKLAQNSCRVHLMTKVLALPSIKQHIFDNDTICCQ